MLLFCLPCTPLSQPAGSMITAATHMYVWISACYCIGVLSFVPGAQHADNKLNTSLARARLKNPAGKSPAAPAEGANTHLSTTTRALPADARQLEQAQTLTVSLFVLFDSNRGEGCVGRSSSHTKTVDVCGVLAHTQLRRGKHQIRCPSATRDQLIETSEELFQSCWLPRGASVVGTLTP